MTAALHFHMYQIDSHAELPESDSFYQYEQLSPTMTVLAVGIKPQCESVNYRLENRIFRHVQS